jgi:Polyprenyl synthetase
MVTGAIYAGATHEEVTLVRQFGRKAAYAFQIVDDVLDAIWAQQQPSNAEPVAAPAGPSLRLLDVGIESSLRTASSLVEEACVQLMHFEPRQNVLTEFVRSLVLRADRSRTVASVV